jgi:hypothetical protein
MQKRAGVPNRIPASVAAAATRAATGWRLTWDPTLRSAPILKCWQKQFRLLGGNTVWENSAAKVRRPKSTFHASEKFGLRFSFFEGKLEVQMRDYTTLNNSLVKLERYERRAFSRRKHALRAISQAS